MQQIDALSRAAVEETIARRWYVLSMLTLVYVLNIADRFVTSTLIEPIKADLRLSDSIMGFLTGTSLATFYVFAGLPLATLADRANRRTMVVLALTAWSVMTACCGFARNFWQLALVRVGVGVGEAGGTPPSISLVSDYFPWRQRALALSLYGMGASLGSMVGSSAGYVSDAWGWRAAFFVLGVPGVLLALVIAATIREPERGRLDASPPPARAGFFDTLSFTFDQPALLHAMIGATVFTLWSWGLMWWTPSFLVRSHHLTLGAAGGALLPMHGLGGTAVLLVTMFALENVVKRDARWVPWLAAAAIVIGTVPSIIAYSTRSSAASIAMLWLFIPLSYAPFGPTFALMQNLVPASMRAQAIAIMLFYANIANLVIAPQAVGLASDALAPLYGSESLRHALIPLAFVGFWAAWHYWLCAKHLPSGLARVGNTAMTSE
ncbi:MAG TPA: MFS transporter [Steroidobacteraceae bacterium]|nr:MFS transporter [Steroidobacteraceae bacterium]